MLSLANNVDARPVLKALLRRAIGPVALERVHDGLRCLLGHRRSAYWSGHVSAERPYGIWIKHLVLLRAAGMGKLPDDVAEFGPGDSTGVGLASLLSGVRKYCGFDAAHFVDTERDVGLVGEIAQLVRQRAAAQKGWPDIAQYLHDPAWADVMAPTASSVERVRELAAALAHAVVTAYEPGDPRPIRVLAPWQPHACQFRAEFDMVFSHSVVQYVDDIDHFFTACAALLRPGGWMSHQIDLSSMRMTRTWNGHLAYSDAVWRFVTSRQPYFPRRWLVPDYLAAARRAGLQVMQVSRLQDPTGLSRNRLALPFHAYPDEELQCRGAFLVARKPIAS
jgi:SAM-dependent methyltransferase